MRRFVSFALFPGLAFGSVAVAMAAAAAGVPDPISVLVLGAAAAAVLLALERWAPHQPDWAPDAAEIRVDLLHVVVSTVVVGAALRAVGVAAVQAGAAAIAEVASLWPSGWPILAQLVLAVLIGDLFSYWNHRLLHTVPALWPLHALHHSAERMHVLMSYRSHPVNSALTSVALTVPVMLLGADPHVLALSAVFNTATGLLRHANVDVRTGPLGWVFQTPELHRWHHSIDVADALHNYGTDTAVWDVVFGTWHAPPGRTPARMGVADLKVPSHYLVHLALPLLLAWRARAARTSTDETSRSDRKLARERAAHRRRTSHAIPAGSASVARSAGGDGCGQSSPRV